MGFKNGDRCLEKAFDDEYLFVLMARDITAPETIIDWIGRNLRTQKAEKLHDALNAALHMIKTHAEMQVRKHDLELQAASTGGSG